MKPLMMTIAVFYYGIGVFFGLGWLQLSGVVLFLMTIFKKE